MQSAKLSYVFAFYFQINRFINSEIGKWRRKEVTYRMIFFVVNIHCEYLYIDE